MADPAAEGRGGVAVEPRRCVSLPCGLPGPEPGRWTRALRSRQRRCAARLRSGPPGSPSRRIHHVNLEPRASSRELLFEFSLHEHHHCRHHDRGHDNEHQRALYQVSKHAEPRAFRQQIHAALWALSGIRLTNIAVHGAKVHWYPGLSLIHVCPLSLTRLKG